MEFLYKELLELEQEFIDTLFYFYACPFSSNANEKYLDSDDRLILESLTYKERKELKVLMLEDRLELNDTYKFHLEMFGEESCEPVVESSQIFKLWDKLELLKSEFQSLSKKEIKKRYSQLLQDYVKLDKDICSGRNPVIERKIKGLLAVKSRYEKKLYPKHKILYEVLHEQAKIKGRWSNLNQAVTSIMPILEERYKDFDLECIRIELTQKRELLCSIEKASLEVKSKRVEEQEIVRQQRKFLNQIRKAKTEIKRLEKLLLLNNPSYELKHKSPFNTEYREEGIIHHLRECREILKEILI